MFTPLSGKISSEFGTSGKTSALISSVFSVEVKASMLESWATRPLAVAVDLQHTGAKWLAFLHMSQSSPMRDNDSGEEVCPRSRVCHCHIQSMLRVVFVAAGSIYRRKIHVRHELQQNCVTVTDHGVLS